MNITHEEIQKQTKTINKENSLTLILTNHWLLNKIAELLKKIIKKKAKNELKNTIQNSILKLINDSFTITFSFWLICKLGTITRNKLNMEKDERNKNNS